MVTAIEVQDLTVESVRDDEASGYLDAAWVEVSAAELQRDLCGYAEPVQALIFAREIRRRLPRIDALLGEANAASPEYARRSKRASDVRERQIALLAWMRKAGLR